MTTSCGMTAIMWSVVSVTLLCVALYCMTAMSLVCCTVLYDSDRVVCCVCHLCVALYCMTAIVWSVVSVTCVLHCIV